MTTRKYSSRAQQTTLALAITSSDTSIQVVSAAVLLPGVTLSATETYTIIIDPDTAIEEILDVKSYTSGNVLSVTRAVDGSSAVAHGAGAVVRHMATGRDFREANTHIESGVGSAVSTTAHGINFSTIIKNTDTGTVNSTMILDGTIVDADINASAAIAKTKISGTAITVADTGTVTSTMILDGTILNADINASAAIAKTKISGTAITAADTGTVTNDMLAGSIPETKHQLVTVGTGSLSGSSTSVSVPATYRRLFVIVSGWSGTGSVGSSASLRIQVNNDTNSVYWQNGGFVVQNYIAVSGSFANTTAVYNSFTIDLADQTSIPKLIGGGTSTLSGQYTGTSAVSSIQFSLSTGTFDAGTYAVYGQ